MTHNIKNVMASTTFIVVLAVFANPASAAEVTGTLDATTNSPVSGGITGTVGGGGSTVSGTLTGSTGGSISGTVSGGSGGGGGGGGGGSGGGGGGGGGGSSVPSQPLGQVLGASTGPIAQADSNGVGGFDADLVPGSPDTSGSNSPLMNLLLLVSGLLSLAGILFLTESKIKSE